MSFAWVRTQHHVALCLALLTAMSGCSPSEKPPALPPSSVAATPAALAETDPEVLTLKAEVARLAAENSQLRMTPHALVAEVRAAIAAQDGRAAEAALKRLADNFPFSAELGPATKGVNALLARLQAGEEEKKRIAALGFKALKTRPVFSYKDTELRVFDSSVTRRWTFDSYGDGWRYLDPEKGQRLLTASVSVSSKSRDPALFGIAAYAADGPTLKQVGSFRYRFSRWQDFGAWLGNHADFRNDFSHTARIPFSVGASVTQEDLRRRPLYLVVTQEGCHKRHQDRLLQPPIHYVPQSCSSLKKTLTVEDFKDGSLAVLRRID